MNHSNKLYIKAIHKAFNNQQAINNKQSTTMANTKVRVSPSESATEFESGTIRTGNDGNEYIITLDKNGKHRWAKHNMTKPTKSAKKQIEEPETIQEQEPVQELKKATKTKKVSKKQVKEVEPVPEPEQEQVAETEEPMKKKVSVRKAPMEHAKDFEEGYEMLGQDGHVHIVKVAKNGVKRWAHAN